jgi:hypothetical protein
MALGVLDMIKKFKAQLKYWTYKKWAAMINDPFGLTDLLSGGMAKNTQSAEKQRLDNFLHGRTEKY